MKRSTGPIYFDGLKAIPLDPEDPGYALVWQTLGGSSLVGTPAENAYRTVGHVRRGLALRANAVASCPRHYYKPSGEEVAEADIPFLDGFTRMLQLIELSLCTWSAFYLFRISLGGRLRRLRYLKAATITPKMNEDGTLTFSRTIAGRYLPPFTEREIVYGWEADPWREYGAGPSVVDAVLTSAGIAAGVAEHAKAFFERGAIHPQLLTVEGPPNPTDAEMLKEWWRRAVAGVRNAFASEVLRVKVNKVDLSSPAKDLAMPELSRAAKEDIATGLGIPYSMLFSDAANYATAKQDEKAFWTLTVRPQLSLIQDELNRQVFAPLGYELLFTPDELAIFQEDEAARATSLASLTGAGMPLDAAMEALGYELSAVDEVRIRYAALSREGLGYEAARAVILMDEELRDNATAVQMLDLLRPAAALPPTPAVETMPSEPVFVEPPPDAAASDLAKWERKALKRLKSGHAAACEFDSLAIPPARAGAISGALKAAADEDAVRRVFAHARVWRAYP